MLGTSMDEGAKTDPISLRNSTTASMEQSGRIAATASEHCFSNCLVRFNARMEAPIAQTSASPALLAASRLTVALISYFSVLLLKASA